MSVPPDISPPVLGILCPLVIRLWDIKRLVELLQSKWGLLVVARVEGHQNNQTWLPECGHCQQLSHTQPIS